jgi:hypothetical protein
LPVSELSSAFLTESFAQKLFKFKVSKKIKPGKYIGKNRSYHHKTTCFKLCYLFLNINFGAQARPPKGVERAPEHWNCVDNKTTFFRSQISIKTSNPTCLSFKVAPHNTLSVSEKSLEKKFFIKK